MPYLADLLVNYVWSQNAAEKVSVRVIMLKGRCWHNEVTLHRVCNTMTIAQLRQFLDEKEYASHGAFYTAAHQSGTSISKGDLAVAGTQVSAVTATANQHSDEEGTDDDEEESSSPAIATEPLRETATLAEIGAGGADETRKVVLYLRV